MKIRCYIEYGAIKALLNICRLVPEAWVFGLFRAIGLLSYAFLARRRITAMWNVELVFPDKTRKEHRRIVRRSFRHSAESIALNTLIMSGRISNRQLLDLVEVDRWDRLESAFADTPGGGLAVSCHIGNWELMSLYIALRINMKCHIIARKTDNPLIEERIMLPMRERFGIQVFYKKNAMMRIMHAARKHEFSGILIDQKLNVQQGIPIEFLGHRAGTTATPALMQIRFGITVIPIFMITIGPKKHRLIIRDPVEWQDNGKPLEEQVAELTVKHQKVIEDIILEYPEQWFWVHDRWSLWKQRKKK